MLRGFSLRDFGASLNTAESYTNESSQGKIGLCETANKQKCTHLGIFLASGSYSKAYSGDKIEFTNTNNISAVCNNGHNYAYNLVLFLVFWIDPFDPVKK